MIILMGGGTEAIIKPVQDTSSGVGVEKIKGIEAIKNNLQEKAAKKGTYLHFNFLMGHAGADLSERMIAALEYPPLRWAYLFGVWFSVVMCIILFLTPAMMILKNKNIKIFIVLIILILDVNSYNGITTQSDQMLLYCVSVFLLLNLSYAVRGNGNEDMCSSTKSIYTRRYPTSCNYNFK